MNMVIIFDLDDTLYEERQFVESGFRTLANWGKERFGWDADESFRFMTDYLDTKGRGKVFDQWLILHDKFTKTLLKECIRIYRNHSPEIQLYSEVRLLLPALSGYPLYIVTDGHKIVQRNKIISLKIKHFFRHTFITHDYGIRHEKPSLYCFEKIREREECNWNTMIYIGDNPAKDFVNLKSVNAVTVRVLTGIHRNMSASPEFDALYTIDDLSFFTDLLEKIEGDNH